MTHLMGYMDAQGHYVRPVFREAFENGGVFLLDEFDSGNSNVITCVNSALSNGCCSFPDGVVKKHEDFVCVAAGNTYGTGADRQYVGRNQLDAASLDRFAFLEWPYDGEIELKYAHEQGGDEALCWGLRVQAIRKAIEASKQRIIVSPRATFGGARLLKKGLSRDQVEEMVIWKGVKKEIKDKVEAELRKDPKSNPQKVQGKQKGEEEKSPTTSENSSEEGQEAGNQSQQTGQSKSKTPSKSPKQSEAQSSTDISKSGSGGETKTEWKSLKEDIEKEPAPDSYPEAPSFKIPVLEEEDVWAYRMGR